MDPTCFEKHMKLSPSNIYSPVEQRLILHYSIPGSGFQRVDLIRVDNRSSHIILSSPSSTPLIVLEVGKCRAHHWSVCLLHRRFGVQ